jgi:hypothetical protein
MGENSSNYRQAKFQTKVMATPSHFQAPWANSVTTITALTIALFASLILIGFWVGPRGQGWWLGLMVGLPLVITLATGLCAVRGYEVGDQGLVILRWGWPSQIPWQDITEVELDPEAMDGSLRLWGNGGLFCFTGTFRNRKLGIYRAYATHPRKSVVLKGKSHPIVVTPDQPDRFVELVKLAINSSNIDSSNPDG